MSEITQTLGFDASQALDTLKQLDSALDRLKSGLEGAASGAAKFNALGQASQRMSKTVRDATAETTQNIQRMTTSLSLLSRIVFTQAIVRALSTVRNSMRATASTAAEFQRRIALIQTIDDSATSFDRLAASVREVSEQYNIPLLEAADGLYQAISNQVGSTAESFDFLAASAKLARATNSSLADSVDLVSGAIKSYNLDTSDADKVSSIFFKTIDLGRITADELSNSFGRVGPVAQAAGLSLEETASAIAAISVRGSNTAESLTQLRAIMTGLLKPTDEMRKVLRDLGFTSSEMALKTLKLPGLLSAITQATGGSNEQLAKLFPNVRGLNGVLGLTNDELSTLRTNIVEVEAAGRSYNDSKFAIVAATDGERLAKEIQALKNAFTVDLGQALLRAGVQLSDFVGGADEVVTVMKSAGPAVLGLAGSFGVFRASVAASRLEMAGLSKALGALSLAPLAAGLGKSLGEYLSEKLDEHRNAPIRALEALNAQDLKSFQDTLASKRDELAKFDQQRVDDARKVFQELGRLYVRDLDKAKSANDGLVANTKDTLNRVLSAREQLANELGRQAGEAQTFGVDSRQRVAELGVSKENTRFQQQIRSLNDSQKVFALAKRSEDLAKQAAEQLAKATDRRSIDLALNAFGRAQQAGEQAQSIAERTNNRVLEGRAAKSLLNTIEEQIRAEQELQVTQANRAKTLEAERKKQQQVVDLIREQAKIALDNTGVLDAEGNPLSQADRDRRQAIRQEALRKIAGTALDQKDLNTTSALGLADFVAKLQGSLSKDATALPFDVVKTEQNIHAAIDRAFSTYRAKSPIDVSALEQALNRRFETPDQISQGVDDLMQKAAELRSQIDSFSSNQPALQNLRSEIDQVFDAIDQRSSIRNQFQGPTSDALRSQFDALLQQMQQLRTDSDITQEELNKVIELRNQFGKSALEGENPLVGRLGWGSSIQLLDQALAKYQELRSLQARPDPGLQQQLDQFNRVLDSMKSDPAAAIKASFSSGASSSATIKANAEATAAAFERGAQALLAASRVRPTAEVAERARGGMVRYFANGGFTPRGRDTQAAMLDPREFVMSAAATRRHFSQLVAMNAGRAPVYRESGGIVDNSVGDITVNVQSGPTGEQTARIIGQQLQREIRRGTSR